MKVKDPGQIRRWRKQRHFSQRDLAFLTRRSQAAIWQIENGKLRTLEEDFALAIAARLDVPWEDLFEAHEVVSIATVTNGVSTTRHAAAAVA
ncbi:helix-turn-helix transcriptional regulator [Litorihabitans aurantiacus]|uniref:HTH cro/C1-type domain-containing protein n=1 Tax=Litorihabitans aurantiacus TaxID=1930061 RepID=A0AA38CTQ9_9MICO|nr:helix-turn-helix transcriptional regulator [Litorihabitans aurantiacus]GMA31570.1 hypothetical protein GCM10025875_15620 [Litorihabitans aurantiacus]